MARKLLILASREPIPRQAPSLDADNDTSRIVECLESQHRLQSPLHPAVVLPHNIVQILTATNLHRVPPLEVEFTVHSHASPARYGSAGGHPE